MHMDFFPYLLLILFIAILGRYVLTGLEKNGKKLDVIQKTNADVREALADVLLGVQSTLLALQPLATLEMVIADNTRTMKKLGLVAAANSLTELANAVSEMSLHLKATAMRIDVMLDADTKTEPQRLIMPHPDYYRSKRDCNEIHVFKGPCILKEGHHPKPHSYKNPDATGPEARAEPRT